MEQLWPIFAAPNNAKSHLHLAWTQLVVRQVSLGLEYHQENDCGFAKYHLADASVSNQPHSFPAAISCSASHNESPISFKILGLLKSTIPKIISPMIKAKRANGRSETIATISEICVMLRGSWPPRRGYSIKINWSTLMGMWDNKAKTKPGNHNIHIFTFISAPIKMY